MRLLSRIQSDSIFFSKGGVPVHPVRRLALTFFLLVALAGVASHFVASNIDDPTSSYSLLFSLSWGLSSLGVVCAAGLTMGCLYGEYSGEPGVFRELADWFFTILAIMTVIVGVIAYCASRVMYVANLDPYGQNGVVVDFDTARFLTMVISNCAGLAFSTFIILAIHVRAEHGPKKRIEYYR